MASSRRRFTVLACVLGGATLAIGVGVATGGKLKTKSASIEVAPDTNEAVAASCGQRQKAVSGGFEQPDFDPTFDEAGFQFYESRKQGARGWNAAAANYGAGAPGTLTSYVYCLRGKGLHQRSASVTIPDAPIRVGSVTAKCEAGQKVVSGGFDNSDFLINDTELLAYESRRKGKRGWTASAVNYDSNPGTLTVYAYCREGPGTKTKSKSTPIDPGATETVTAKCKKGQRLLAGGFDNPDFAQDFGPDPQILPFASKKSGKRKWTASGYGNSGGAGTFTTYAYCEKKKAK